MSAPPDEAARTHEPGPAPDAGQIDDKIIGLAAAGLPVRRIAAEVGMPKSTVQDRLTHLLRTRTQRASDEFVAMREVRLEDLFRRAYAVVATAEKGSDAWGRAWDRCLRAEESLRKLKGADAPEAMTIALERRIDDEATDVVEVLLKVIPDALRAADLDGAFRAKLTQYALELASWHLRSTGGEDPGPAPEAPRPQLALPPGPSAAAPEAPPLPRYREPDGADAVLAQLAKFEDEFGSLEDDDEG
ncbi:hypothetical protein EJ357_03555 [Streptomyces cyaneochromogenes]|uniref:Uncharacterized protein n=1 Tax=Streptomyces cyaneochromogenes TaxID=2496836 RepID=A0A3S9M0C2_9ACTN|nr:hypothetical protein [Streptomyces cyaneochromogenes]AZQ32632.1 hypothetical protein EJ357_03555 [Streptomyces cyaneochromogenes]